MHERLFADHLAFHCELAKGKVDFSTMVMELPEPKTPLFLLVEAHETIHVNLTYSTTLGIFLDLLSTLSTVKLMNILREAPPSTLKFPLFSYIDEPHPLHGQILFAFILEKALFYGTGVWRPLQEGIATYMMLEEAPRLLTMFTKEEVEKTLNELRTKVRTKEKYYSGYVKMKEAAKNLGQNQVYAACFLASDLPLYSQIFVQEKKWKMRGDFVYRELQKFSQLLRGEFNPLQRFDWIATHVDGSNLREDINAFTPFVVPHLFPHTDWEERNTKWIEHVSSGLGGASAAAGKEASAGFKMIIQEGKPPVVRSGEGTRFLHKEFGLLKYILGSLKAVCYYGEERKVVLPVGWKELSVAPFIEDAQTFTEKHGLPFCISGR